VRIEAGLPTPDENARRLRAFALTFARQIRQAQASQDRLNAILQVIAASVLEAGGNLAILLQQARQPLLITCAHGLLQLTHTLLQPAQMSHRLQNQILYAATIKIRHALRQIAWLNGRTIRKRTLVRLLLAHQQAQQSRFAHAIRPNQPDTLARVHHKADRLQNLYHSI
jgi:hypothetical protein